MLRTKDPEMELNLELSSHSDWLRADCSVGYSKMEFEMGPMKALLTLKEQLKAVDQSTREK